MNKEANPNAAVIVDNCYGEFVETMEPTHVGADLVVGSLIKNPGGGLAPTGGYIAGRRDLVEGAAMRLTVPGIGAECGSPWGTTACCTRAPVSGPPHGGPGGQDRRVRRPGDGAAGL